MTGTNRLCHYLYDPLDRLATVTPQPRAIAQHFYKDGVLATTLQGTEQRTFMRAQTSLLAQLDPSGNVMLATDRNNSVLQANTKQVQTPVVYSAYGHRQCIATLPGLPGFNGEQANQVTGHYLLGNGYRAYNPVLMRFNSPDSLSPFGKGGLNAYAYCLGNPIKLVDPTGHFGGLSKVLADLMITGAGKAVETLKAFGNHVASPFAKGLSGRGAPAAGKHFASLKERAITTISNHKLSTAALPNGLAEELANQDLKAKSAVLKVFATQGSFRRHTSRWPSSMNEFSEVRFSTLLNKHPDIKIPGGQILDTQAGRQAIAVFEEHAMKYYGKGKPMDLIKQLAGQYDYSDHYASREPLPEFFVRIARQSHFQKVQDRRKPLNPLP
jgi:RHS repeat-associated protein